MPLTRVLYPIGAGQLPDQASHDISFPAGQEKRPVPAQNSGTTEANDATLPRPTTRPLKLRKRTRKGSVPHEVRHPSLTEETILEWADAHFSRTGAWPHLGSGPVLDVGGEKWANVNTALGRGLRGLPGGSSIARLLAEHRGTRNRKALPALTVAQIVAWADAHFQRTGYWPHSWSGPIAEAPGETWTAVVMALRKGLRGLPGDCSLAQLLEEERGVRNIAALPLLTMEQILTWADNHFARTGTWPAASSGAVVEAPDNTWSSLNQALHQGRRGFPAGSSLAKLLAEQRGIRNRMNLPDLTTEQILAWADAHHARTGKWPISHSGAVVDAPGETWEGVNTALDKGNRGLPGGSTLARLLLAERGVKHHLTAPKLTEAQIWEWAREYYQAHGRWPSQYSGEIAAVPGENWHKINYALTRGGRGLPGGSSLPRLIQERAKLP